MNKLQKKLEKELQELQQILKIEKLPKYLSNDLKCLPIEKDEKYFIQKVYDVIKKECNPKQLLFYSFISVTNRDTKKQKFYMINFISKKCIYPYELTKVLNIKKIEKALDVVYEIIASKIGLFPDKKILEKTFLELKKTVLIENFLNPYERDKVNYQNWIKDYSFEDFLLRLVFSKDIHFHIDRELFKKYIELVKLNMNIEFLQ